MRPYGAMRIKGKIFMSVIKSKRSVSGVQFLDTAKELQIFTMRTCSKFPKHYNPILNWKIIDKAVAVYDYVVEGNAIFPSNEKEYEWRREHFISAGKTLRSLIAQINIAYETFPIADKTITKWMELINREIALIKNVIKADKERYKF